MTTTVKFTKMHGAGNDYIYVNTLLYNIADPTKAAIAWSAPHTGIGSDGLVLIGESKLPEADYSMRIFNADGSEAMMCGNASRCIGKYLFEKGITDKTEIRLLTLSGIKILRLHLDESGKKVEHEGCRKIENPVKVGRKAHKCSKKEDFSHRRRIYAWLFMNLSRKEEILFHGNGSGYWH